MGRSPNAERSWWGWGLASETRVPGNARHRPVEDLNAAAVPPPRIALAAVPADLRPLFTDDVFERVLHSRGRSFEDVMRNLYGDFSNVTDLVAFPASNADVLAVLGVCEALNAACVVFGGGSSVVDGLSPPAHGKFRGTVTMDLKRLDRVLEIDHASQSVRVQAGMYGPALEAALKPHGLTLRHYPQSFEFSTVGGWVVTRAGGHFATLHTRIDPLVQALTLCSPAGVTTTRRLPSSGAGPHEAAHYIGSEGIYGVVTEAWLRVRPRPTHRLGRTVFFHSPHGNEAAFLQGAKCVRAIMHAGLLPANLRLVDGKEVVLMNSAKGSIPVPLRDSAMLLIGFESHSFAPTQQLEHTLAICRAHNAVIPDPVGDSAKSDAAEAWGKSFMRGGYWRNQMCLLGFVSETFETAVTWDKFERFHAAVLRRVREAGRRVCGQDPLVTFRFTHLYPDGPAVYYTVVAPGTLGREVEQWKAIKRASLEAIIEEGGTCTHHHAVGKMHAGALALESGALFHDSMVALKRVHDPKGIMNPGVLGVSAKL